VSWNETAIHANDNNINKIPISITSIGLFRYEAMYSVHAACGECHSSNSNSKMEKYNRLHGTSFIKERQQSNTDQFLCDTVRWLVMFVKCGKTMRRWPIATIDSNRKSYPRKFNDKFLTIQYHPQPEIWASTSGIRSHVYVLLWQISLSRELQRNSNLCKCEQYT